MIALLATAAAADWTTDVDRDAQWEILTHLTGEADLGDRRIRSRNIHHPDHRLARDYLWARLRSIPGLVTREEPFSAEGEDDLANLIGIVRGTDPSLDPIVLSAHYDSTASLDALWSPEDSPAPGADDDASGCAAILELARILVAEPGFERDIELVLFDAEEEGLLGAAHHVENRERGVHVMVSLDPIGFNAGGAGWLFASAGPDTDAEIAAFDASMMLQEPEFTAVQRFDAVDASLIGPPRSDHGPFLDAGFAALHIGTFPQPPTYHTPDDTLDVVDPAFLADTTALVGLAVEDLARPVEERRRACDGRGGTGPTGLLCTGLALAAARRRGSSRRP